jgi:hypothetical protein
VYSEANRLTWETTETRRVGVAIESPLARASEVGYNHGERTRPVYDGFVLALHTRRIPYRFALLYNKERLFGTSPRQGV